MYTNEDIHETDTEPDEDEDEEEGELYIPKARDSLDEVLRRRTPLGNSLFNTGLSTQQGWLESWTIFMCIRELLQNFVDHVLFKTEEEVKIVEVMLSAFDPEVADLITSTGCRKLKPRDFVKSVDGLRFFDAFVGTIVVGRVISGRGCFFLLQYDSSLSRECIYQRSTKGADLKLAGTHGCGMKESALRLLDQGAELRMWMPAKAKDDKYPGESWTWTLRERIMKVQGNMSIKYKARALLTVVRNLPSSFTFDPRKYLFFESSMESMQIIRTPIMKVQEVVLDYQILIGSSGVFNYGIFVEDTELTKKLGFGLNGRYKLADRYRTRADDLKGRLAAAIKVAVRKKPALITPLLMEYAKTDSLEWVFPQVPRAEDSETNHNFQNLKELLIHGITKTPRLEASQRSILLLTGPEWTRGERAIAVSLGYVVFEIADSIHRYEDKVLRPALKSRGTDLSATSAVAVHNFFVKSCGLTQYRFWEFKIDGLTDESAIQPFYVFDDQVYLSLVGPEGASLKGSDKEVCMGLISKLISHGPSNLLEKVFEALDRGRYKPLTACMEDNNDVGGGEIYVGHHLPNEVLGEKRAHHGELLSLPKRTRHGDDVSSKLLAEVAEVAEELGKKSDAQAYADTQLQDFKRFKGKTEFMAAAVKDEALFSSLLNAHYTTDARLGNGLLWMPDANMRVTRDTGGRITLLQFRDGTSIGGVALEKLGFMIAFKNMGHAGIIWEDNTISCTTGLVLPLYNAVKGKKRDWPTKGDEFAHTHMFFLRSSKKMYCYFEDLVNVICAKDVPLSNTKEVLEAMNSLAAVDHSFDFQEPSLDYAVRLLSESSMRATKAYAGALMGALMATATTEDRTETFLENGATFSLASALRILKPYQKPLVDEELKPLTQKVIAELGEEDEVLLSTLPIPSQYYTTVQLTDNVYVRPEFLYGTKNGEKLAKLNNVSTITGDLFKSIVSGIVRARKVSLVKAPAPPTVSVQYDDIAL